MKVLRLQLPDRLAGQMEALIKDGWFVDEEELARQALVNFISRQRFHLQEQFQLEDIQWALDSKGSER